MNRIRSLVVRGCIGVAVAIAGAGVLGQGHTIVPDQARGLNMELLRKGFANSMKQLEVVRAELQKLGEMYNSDFETTCKKAPSNQCGGVVQPNGVVGDERAQSQPPTPKTKANDQKLGTVVFCVINACQGMQDTALKDCTDRCNKSVPAGISGSAPPGRPQGK